MPSVAPLSSWHRGESKRAQKHSEVLNFWWCAHYFCVPLVTKPLSVKLANTILFTRCPMAEVEMYNPLPGKRLNDILCHRWHPSTHATVHLTLPQHGGWLDYSFWLPGFNSHFLLFGSFRIGKPDSFRVEWTFRDLVLFSYFSCQRTKGCWRDLPKITWQDLTTVFCSQHPLVKVLDRNCCFANCKRKHLHCS